jgi:hypothetical protein
VKGRWDCSTSTHACVDDGFNEGLPCGGGKTCSGATCGP